MIPSRIAQRILSVYWDGCVPVNVDCIAEQIGVEVTLKDDLDCVAVVVYRNEANAYSVALSETEAPIRRRYALAYAIGVYPDAEQTGLQRTQD